ncbi:hypothetical protein [Mycoplasmopsis pullorum]|uniref:hypothetical protein n=1 Tax=Mycoplasmopsis pullorum TaxID=48003 RepID=UPI00111AF528|nr:hypothetical protein [Mycoplasmopsis pullorum]TNK85964.1 hypothetical protein C4M85_01860 [Mycoplasmopsis pullorum]
MNLNLFQFRQNKLEQNYSFVQKTSPLRRSLRQEINIFLIIILVILLVLPCISLFWKNSDLQILKDYDLDKNIVSFLKRNDYVQKSLIGKNQKIKELLDNYDAQYFISENLSSQVINFRFADLLKSLNLRYPMLGTDASGNDVLVDSLHKIFYSLFLCLTLFIFEMCLGLIVGSYTALKQNVWTKTLNEIQKIMISVPDILIIIIGWIFNLIQGNSLSSGLAIIYCLIFFTGTMRAMYWARELSVDVLKKDFIIALKVNDISNLRLIFIHLIPAILAEILILFARRVGYIIFLIGTISFLGLNIENSIAQSIKDNWKWWRLNPMQIFFPVVYLFVFLITWQMFIISFSIAINPIQEKK